MVKLKIIHLLRKSAWLGVHFIELKFEASVEKHTLLHTTPYPKQNLCPTVVLADINIFWTVSLSTEVLGIYYH